MHYSMHLLSREIDGWESLSSGVYDINVSEF